MKIGLVVNRSKPGAAAVVKQLLALGDQSGISILMESDAGKLMHQRGHALSRLIEQIDLLLVVGGDGSLLRVVHQIYPSPLPILGINLGRLGFLTAVRYDELTTVMPAVFAAKLRTSHRLPLEIVVHSKEHKRIIPCALNDVVVSRSGSRMALIRVHADGLFLNEYIADGLILATPTGSTAYAMAAGGPIMSPETDGIVVNPICPHTLTNRSLVLAGKSIIRLEVPPQEQALSLQYDGCDGGTLHPGDSAEVRTATAPVNLSFLENRDFYQILREKLKWSGNTIGADVEPL